MSWGPGPCAPSPFRGSPSPASTRCRTCERPSRPRPRASRHVVHHVLTHQPLVLAGGAVDREHGQSPLVLLGRVDGHPVSRIRKHLAEGGPAYRPRARLCGGVLARSAHAELGHGARPARTAGAALVAETAQVLPLVAEQIAVARDVEARRAPAVVVLVVEPFDSAGRARPEVVIHEI